MHMDNMQSNIQGTNAQNFRKYLQSPQGVKTDETRNTYIRKLKNLVGLCEESADPELRSLSKEANFFSITSYDSAQLIRQKILNNKWFKEYTEKDGGFCQAAINNYCKYLLSLEVLHKEQEKSDGGHQIDSLNTVLFGAPGTGKTYSTKQRAVSIIDGKASNQDAPAEEISERYKELVNEKRIGFVTFHQSFSYEDFVEGIRPSLDNREDESSDNDGAQGVSTLAYACEDGVFKAFCEHARTAAAGASLDLTGLRDNPNVWKIPLEGTGDNSTRRDCLADQNGHIRIGYDKIKVDENGGITGPKEGRTVVNALYNRLQTGDLVCSCWSASEIDAVGIVTGAASYNETYSKYRHVRPVRWLWRRGDGDPLPFLDLNSGVNMTLSSVYELKRVRPSDLLEAVRAMTGSEAETVPTDKPYVFIIDELNRGNVAAIFGELITLLEEDKRLGADDERKVTLPYSKQRWGIPSNVYVIATMNTADRSLTKLDAAFRRRFTFEEVGPDYDALRSTLESRGHAGGVVEGVDVPWMLRAMNARIEALLDRDHVLGHSMFWKVNSLEDIRKVFSGTVIPLLQDYFFEDYDLIRAVLNDSDGIFVRKINGTSDSDDLGIDPSILADNLSDAVGDRYEIIDGTQEGALRARADMPATTVWESDDFKNIYEKFGPYTANKYPDDQETVEAELDPADALLEEDDD